MAAAARTGGAHPRLDSGQGLCPRTMADAMARAHGTADEDDDFYDIPAVSDRRAEAQHADQLARRLNSLASALNARSAAGNWLGVVALHDEAILAASEAQASHPETAGEINHVLGNAYYALGQYGVAIELHHAHAKIAQSACDRVGFATAYSNLGSAHHMLGQFDSAIAVVEQYRLVESGPPVRICFADLQPLCAYVTIETPRAHTGR